ncbi:trace amine-associated receptor 1-like [Ambystoma mexicanum]|uniref:trace amine-associated receptor 1-like n=1 Tax=Ambystoma mexicanum TaxID=8296 RepID=UPI0037E75B1A
MQNSSNCPDLTNSSMNAVGDLCFSTVKSPTIKLILYVLIFSLIVATLIGNVLVVISIAYFKQLRSSTHYFVLSLAVADFLVGVTVMPYSMIRTIEGCWHFGNLFCQFHSSLDVMFCTASILHLSCIAFDRYYAVCNPLLYGYKMSSQRVAALIVTCWIVPVLISFVPIMLGLHMQGIESVLPENICVLLVNRVYAVCASSVAFYLPMLLMLSAYWKIYKAARKQALQIHAIEKQVSSPGTTQGKRKYSMRRERKAAKTLGVIISIFLAFWTPFFTANVVDPFIGYRTGMVVWEVFIWLGYVNSAINPLLYGFFHRSFRKAFLIIIGGRICMSGSSSITNLSKAKLEVVETIDKLL